MHTLKKYPKMLVIGAILACSVLTGCGQKGALYLPTSDSKQVVNPVAKPTNSTANGYDTKVETNTQDPNIMVDHNASPIQNSATDSASVPSDGGKNDY